jgi:hypothetical protein
MVKGALINEKDLFWVVMGAKSQVILKPMLLVAL